MTLRITTITTRYDHDEDRIRLAVADAGRVVRVLWLTRRLAERLVPALVQGLQISSEESDTKPAEVKAAQVYAKLEARLARKPGKLVVADQAEQGRVHEMKVRNGSNGMRVIEFHCKGLEMAELVLKPQEMRLWLEALHLAFVKGQWRLDIWPQWLQTQPKSRLKPRP